MLEGAKGRLERVGERNGAPIFVDYAHKPDALAKALQALRPYARRKLVVVFGAGGDRDARQTSVDGRDRQPKMPIMSSSPTTIRAAKIRKRSAPRSWPLRRAPAKSATAPRRSGPRSRARAGRCAADRRQGPRDRTDRRRPRAAVQRSRCGGSSTGAEGRMSAAPLWTIAEVARALGPRRKNSRKRRSTSSPRTAAW